MGPILGIRSIPKAISLSREIPRRSLGKTSGNLLTTGIDYSDRLLVLKSLTLTRWYKQTLRFQHAVSN